MILEMECILYKIWLKLSFLSWPWPGVSLALKLKYKNLKKKKNTKQ